MARPSMPTANKKLNRNQLITRIVKSGYPELLNRELGNRSDAWFNSYITTILQCDIRDIANIEVLTELPRLLSLIAGRATAILNFAELSRTVAMPQTTLKRYMTLLEITFLIHYLPAWQICLRYPSIGCGA